MKRIAAILAFTALSPVAYAADMPMAPVEEAVVAEANDWSGYFVGIQGGYAFADLSLDFEGEDDALPFDASVDEDADGFVVGLFYGRNWQSGNLVYGLDSSISYLDLDGDDIDFGDVDDLDVVDGIDVEANILGLTRLKLGYSFDNFLVFAAGGLATTRFEVETVAGDGFESIDDDSFGFGFTVGGGVEAKLSENWSARVEYIYVNIEDDFDLDDDLVEFESDLDVELEANIVRGGIAYHF